MYNKFTEPCGGSTAGGRAISPHRGVRSDVVVNDMCATWDSRSLKVLLVGSQGRLDCTNYNFSE